MSGARPDGIAEVGSRQRLLIVLRDSPLTAAIDPSSTTASPRPSPSTLNPTPAVTSGQCCPTLGVSTTAVTRLFHLVHTVIVRCCCCCCFCLLSDITPACCAGKPWLCSLLLHAAVCSRYVCCCLLLPGCCCCLVLMLARRADQLPLKTFASGTHTMFPLVPTISLSPTTLCGMYCMTTRTSRNWPVRHRGRGADLNP